MVVSARKALLEELHRHYHNGIILRTPQLNIIIQKYAELCDRAVEQSLFFPYCREVEQTLQEFQIMRRNFFQMRQRLGNDFGRGFDMPIALTKVPIGPYRLQYGIGGGELQQGYQQADSAVTLLEQRREVFYHLRQAVSRHISLEISPNELFEGRKPYLGQGRLIFPINHSLSKRYHVLRIYHHPGREENDCIELEPLTTLPLPTLEEAMERYVEPNILGTVAIAKNTECYDMEGTVLPVLQHMYQQRFLGKEK